MNALVVHWYWAFPPGGGVLLSAAAAHALDLCGYRPVLVGVTGSDPSRFANKWFGIELSKYPMVTLPFRLKPIGIYSKLLVWIPVKLALSRFQPRVMFTDDPGYGPLLGHKPKNTKIIEYIHFPAEIVADPRLGERYGGFPMNLYWRGYQCLLSKVARKNPFRDADLVLTNSRWTARLVKMAYGEEPVVLNPPLPPNVELLERPMAFEDRGPNIVMLGRFSEEKQYHHVVSEIMPRLIKEVGGARLYIIGAATTTGTNYVNRLISIGERQNLRVSKDLVDDADVHIIPNFPRKLVNFIMDSSRAFLHATVNEHWGIAIAEAMARGLPVVVHKSGGAWFDLAGEGEFGLKYEDTAEAVEMITRLLVDSKIWNHYSLKSLERASNLKLEKFVEKMGRLLATLLS